MNRDDYFYNSEKNPTKDDQLGMLDVNKLITPKQQKKFINNIFNGNVSDFQKFIKLIKNINNWKNANILIDFYFYKNGARPDSKDAKEFKEIIYRIYFPLSK